MLCPYSNIAIFILNYTENRIFQTLSGKLPLANEIEAKISKPSDLSQLSAEAFPLSWSHYCLLIRIDEPFKREFYESECIKG
ncbi:MAG: DUF1016 domain-containing protein, partial [Candidatus Poribacteria bacterium]